MGEKTEISWTDSTWNPIRGCSKVSTGCTHCYAATMAARFSGEGQPYEGLAYRDAKGQGQWTGEVRVIDGHMHDPLRWREGRRVFVNSMSDLFHENLATVDVAEVFAVMAACHALGKGHVFQVLTKRPERMQRLMTDETFQTAVQATATMIVDEARLPFLIDMPWPLPNVWLGTSIEDQDAADERLPALLETPAAVRFLSCEPLLGPLDLHRAAQPAHGVRKRIGWIIVGGESGPNARPMHPEWPRALRDWCQEPGFEVPFFFKQWGGRRPGGLARLDGVEHHAFPDAADQ